MLIAFHKPYGVLSQFNENPDYPDQRTLEEFNLPENLLPIGRLDRDSEGLLLLTDTPSLERKLLLPKGDEGHSRVYLAQVDGTPSDGSLESLRKGGLKLKTHTTLPCGVSLAAAPPCVAPRMPAVRTDIETSWLEITLKEGKNRQVRRMTAAIGHPTLRLIRTSIDKFRLGELAAGRWRPV